MNIFIIKQGQIEITINVDNLTEMEFTPGQVTKEDDSLKLLYINGTERIFKGASARALQFDLDMMLYKISGETGVIELDYSPTKEDMQKMRAFNEYCEKENKDDDDTLDDNPVLVHCP